jgi:prolycopene isomerase
MDLCFQNPVKCGDRLFSALNTSTYYKLGTSNLGFNGPVLENRKKKKKLPRMVTVKSVSSSVVASTVQGTKRDGGESLYDAIVIGSGIGGLVAATQLAVKEARVLVLEKYLIPGGSSGFYERDGYTFDVGSSVMFGFSDKVCLFIIL